MAASGHIQPGPPWAPAGQRARRCWALSGWAAAKGPPYEPIDCPLAWRVDSVPGPEAVRAAVWPKKKATVSPSAAHTVSSQSAMYETAAASLPGGMQLLRLAGQDPPEELLVPRAAT